MTSHEPWGLAFLAYLVVPLVLLLLFWLIGFVRRKVFKRGGGEEAGVEGES